MKTFSAIFILGLFGVLLLPSISFAASINSVSPSTGQRGETVSISINLSEFDFSIATVRFQNPSGGSSGINALGGAVFPPSRIDTTINISASAALGDYKIIVQSGPEGGTSRPEPIELANAFTVTAPLDFSITSINIRSSNSGKTFSMVISGKDFNTAQGITGVNFVRLSGSGSVSTSNIVVETPRRIKFTVTVPQGTSSGTFQIQVTQFEITKSSSVIFTVTGTGGGTTQQPSIPTGTVPTTGEAPPPGFGLPTGPTSGAQIIGIIQTAGNWVFAIFLSLSLIYILLAAFQFITNGGDIEKISQARQKLVYAIVGIAIALVAAGFDNVLRSILGL